MFTYDLNTDIGKVRLLCTDTDQINNIFEDDEISGFLNMTAYDGDKDVRLAAALALETIATSEALVQKKMSVLDVSTDGPAVAASLMQRAQKLRDDFNNEVSIETIEANLNTFTARDLFFNRRL